MSDDPGGGARSRALRVVHHHPGRIRTRADVLEDAPELGERIRAVLIEMTGVARVHHNPHTGSLLVDYEPGVADPNALLQAIAEIAGLDDIVDDAHGDEDRRNVRQAIFDGARVVDGAVLEMSGGRADLRAVVSAALVGASVYSFLFNKKEHRLPRWDNLLWWSYSVLADARHTPSSARG